jgi:hypothetical protein
MKCRLTNRKIKDLDNAVFLELDTTDRDGTESGQIIPLDYEAAEEVYEQLKEFFEDETEEDYEESEDEDTDDWEYPF